jgi:hypothetical protein
LYIAVATLQGIIYSYYHIMQPKQLSASIAIHSTSCHALGIIGKLSMSRGGALIWFHNVSTYYDGDSVIEY